MFEEVDGFFKPTEILHRDEQIKEIREVFQRFKENKRPKNILCYGFSGSGKTTCINKVLSEQNNLFIYIPSPSTAHQVLKNITDMTYNTREKLRSEAIRKMKNQRRIVIIDELNAMKRIEEIRWLFEDLKFIYRETPFPLIVITNKNLYETRRIIPDDVHKTFFFNDLEFFPYNANELNDIFKNGIKNLNIEIPDGFLGYLSAKIHKEFDGSVRSGLFILRECIEDNNFSFEKVDRLLKKIQNSEFEEVIKRLPEQEKRFLSTLIYLRDEQFPDVPLSSLYEKIKDLLPQRISQLIVTLEVQGIIVRTSHETDKRKKFIRFIRNDIFEKTKRVIEEMRVLPLV